MTRLSYCLQMTSALFFHMVKKRVPTSTQFHLSSLLSLYLEKCPRTSNSGLYELGAFLEVTALRRNIFVASVNSAVCAPFRKTVILSVVVIRRYGRDLLHDLFPCATG